MTSNEPDYSEYSLVELYDALQHIDRDRFPERAHRIEQEIETRPRPSSPISTLHPSRISVWWQRYWPMTLGAIAIIIGIIGLYRSASTMPQALSHDYADSLQQFTQIVENTPDTAEARAREPELWSVLDVAKLMAEHPRIVRALNTAYSILLLLIRAAYLFAGIQLWRRASSGVSVLIICTVANILTVACLIAAMTILLKFTILQVFFASILPLAVPSALLLAVLACKRFPIVGQTVSTS